MSRIEEFAKTLNIPFNGNIDNRGRFVIKLDNDTDFAKVYSIVSNNSDLDFDAYSSIINDKINQLVFFNDDFDVKLNANFGSNVYEVVVSEVEE